MLFGILLGFAQRFGADDVELDVVPVHLEIAAHEMRPLVQAILGEHQ